MNPGDLIRYRTGRNSITRDLVWDIGLVIQVEPDDFDGGDKCKILCSGGILKWIRIHGTTVLNHNETW